MSKKSKTTMVIAFVILGIISWPLAIAALILAAPIILAITCIDGILDGLYQWLTKRRNKKK